MTKTTHVTNWDDVTTEYQYEHCLDCDCCVVDGVRTLLGNLICEDCSSKRCFAALEEE